MSLRSRWAHGRVFAERGKAGSKDAIAGHNAYDPHRPASFPSNGRTPTDDAGGAFLALLTNGRITGAKVRAHNDLLAEFPYLGPPHNT